MGTRTLALARSMKNMAEAVTGLEILVVDCTNQDAIAYSTLKNGRGTVAVSFGEHFDGLNEDETRCILYGLFAHEVMHLVRTDFSVLETELPRFKPAERKDRKDLANICEDPAIEYRSREHLSGFLCGCLDKTIEYMSRNSAEIQEGADAYLQYLASMIMFGDLGVLRGEFTFPEAEDAFIRTAPKMLELIENPDSRERFFLSQEIFEDIRPLWEEHNKRLLANAETDSFLKQAGVTETSGDGSGPGSSYSPDADQDDNTSEVSERRRKLVQQILDGKPAAWTGDVPLGDEKFPDMPFSIGEGLQDEARTHEENAEKQIQKEARENARHQEEDNMRPQVRSTYYGEVRYQVRKVDAGDEAEYYRICECLRPDISNMKALLRKAFHTEYARKAYRTSGKVSVARCCGKKMTARVFERRYTPDNTTDLSIVILADQSGSMETKMPFVKDTLVLILEALAPFHIPVKVIGFTQYHESYDADYMHYGSWKNDRKMRSAVAGMQAQGATFLGHAIRYGTEIIRTRKEKNRLFIMITDGQPWHRRYRDAADGVKDCKDAVRELKRYAEVIGIGMFGSDEDVFKDIFKDKTVIVENPSSLTHQLPKLIGKLLK